MKFEHLIKLLNSKISYCSGRDVSDYSSSITSQSFDQSPLHLDDLVSNQSFSDLDIYQPLDPNLEIIEYISITDSLIKKLTNLSNNDGQFIANSSEDARRNVVSLLDRYNELKIKLDSSPDSIKEKLTDLLNKIDEYKNKFEELRDNLPDSSWPWYYKTGLILFGGLLIGGTIYLIVKKWQHSSNSSITCNITHVDNIPKPTVELQVEVSNLNSIKEVASEIDNAVKEPNTSYNNLNTKLWLIGGTSVSGAYLFKKFKK